MADDDERLSATDVATLLGIKVDTWWSYVTRAKQRTAAGKGRPTDAPQPDGEYLGRLFWLRSTIERWQGFRPGQPARTDLWDWGHVSPQR